MSSSPTQETFWQPEAEVDAEPRRTAAQIATDGITAHNIKKLLHLRHAAPRNGLGGWAVFDEFIPGTGTSSSAGSRIDVWAMNVWPSGGFVTIAYEIKVSRGDFLRELKDDHKRDWALTFSDEFYFVAPKDLIKPDELPDNSGLIEVAWVMARGMYEIGDKRYNMRVKTKAPARAKAASPSWALLASVARRVARQEAAEPPAL